VWVNQTATRVLSRLLQVADVVDVLGEDDERLAPGWLPEPLPILFEDAWILAVDKTFGLATQSPIRRRPDEHTAHERALLQLAAREGRRMELLLFHRLDRLTTGVLVLARSHDAARSLAAAWAQGQARKRYLAIVDGDPGPGERLVEGAVGRDPLVPGRFRVTGRGKPAESLVRRLHTTGAFSLVEVRPLTGRTHQVRIHLALLGTPVAGDALYGGSGSVWRPFLHAWRLTLPHPHTGDYLDLESPLPADMQAAASKLGLPVPPALV
jgi:23S rRNA pseudouridine1911/1915/1917 synthase